MTSIPRARLSHRAGKREAPFLGPGTGNAQARGIEVIRHGSRCAHPPARYEDIARPASRLWAQRSRCTLRAAANSSGKKQELALARSPTRRTLLRARACERFIGSIMQRAEHR